MSVMVYYTYSKHFLKGHISSIALLLNRSEIFGEFLGFW